VYTNILDATCKKWYTYICRSSFYNSKPPTGGVYLPETATWEEACQIGRQRFATAQNKPEKRVLSINFALKKRKQANPYYFSGNPQLYQLAICAG